MAGSPLPAARAQGAEAACCPGCGAGELFTIRITRPGGGEWRGAYCAGRYDRDRRRFVRPSCGFSSSMVEIGSGPSGEDDRAARTHS